MGETRVDLRHLLEDLRDAYPETTEETMLTETVANALDSGASTIDLRTDPAAATFTVTDDGAGMRRRDLRRYHDVAATTKTRGRGIGFAGVGIKLGLLLSDEVLTETRRGKEHIATTWRLTNKQRAPWSWIQPLGLVDGHGTAVRLQVHNALSPLLDAGFLEALLYRHFAPLLDPSFDVILSEHYPDGVRFVLNGKPLNRQSVNGGQRASLSVKLPRKRKPSGVGYLTRHGEPLPEAQRGMAISTFGKVIRRGWDWLGLTPADPEVVTGLIEVPALAEALTLNKADFLRRGTHGALYLAYRRAIQAVVAERLDEWGMTRDRVQKDTRRVARPVERDLEKILIDLSQSFPLLPTLIERLSGGQRRLPMGVAKEDARQTMPVAGPEPKAGQDTESTEEDGESNHSSETERREPNPPPTGMLEPGTRGPRRRSRYRLRIQFEARPGDDELARLVQSTVWINEAHPAYRRAVTSRAMGYHLALATAMALAKLAVEPAQEHDFITAFLARWGETTERRSKGKRRGKA